MPVATVAAAAAGKPLSFSARLARSSLLERPITELMRVRGAWSLTGSQPAWEHTA